MKIVRTRVRCNVPRQTFNPGKFDVDGAPGHLHPVFDEQEHFLGKRQTQSLEQRWGYDGVGDAGFVLQRHEKEPLAALGGLR